MQEHPERSAKSSSKLGCVGVSCISEDVSSSLPSLFSSSQFYSNPGAEMCNGNVKGGLMGSVQLPGLNTLVEMVGAGECELEALRLAGHQCSMIVSSQSDLNLLSPCGFPVCRSVGSVSKPVSSSPSLSLPSAASGRGGSLGLLAWAHQAVTSSLGQHVSQPHVASPAGAGACKGVCMARIAPACAPCSLTRSPASPAPSPAALGSSPLRGTERVPHQHWGEGHFIPGRYAWTIF